jgi:hypothetical protein
VIRKIKPIGSNMWEQVASEYNKEARLHDRKDRDADSLKKCFTDKVKEGKTKPTGTPQIPWDVEEAREIWNEIQELIHMGSVDDGDAEPEWDGSKEDEAEGGLEGEGEGEGEGQGEGGDQERQEGPARRSAASQNLSVTESRNRPDHSTVCISSCGSAIGGRKKLNTVRFARYQFSQSQYPVRAGAPALPR